MQLTTRSSELSYALTAGALLATLLAAGCGDDDGAPTDAGGGRDSSVSDAARPPVDSGSLDGAPRSDAGPAPVCGTSAWETYGHDAQRSSASDACIRGPLTMLWRYAPAPPSGRTFNFVAHAVAATDGVYLGWAASNGGYLGTTALDRVTLDGARAWTWDSGSDANLAHWPTLAFDYVVANDDQVAYVARADGMRAFGTSVDYWGETAFADGRLYLVNDEYVDGPKLFVGAFDATATELWRANEIGRCRIGTWDQSGGAIAADAGTLFYAPQYRDADGAMPELAQGVYAFDGATGMMRWTQATTPTSRISAGGGRVYLVEGTSLVARSQTDGTIAWSASVTGAGFQPPVLVAGLAVIADAASVRAFDASSGTQVWSTPLAGAVSRAGTQGLSGGCGMSAANIFSGRSVATTTIAAAAGSATLVVTSSSGITILDVSSGAQVWTGAISGAMGGVREPVLVGNRVYVLDSTGLVALASAG